MNSFDQWGVELGKVLGVKVRKYLSQARSGGMGQLGWDANMFGTCWVFATIEPTVMNCAEMLGPGGGDVSGFQKPTQQLDFAV